MSGVDPGRAIDILVLTGVEEAVDQWVIQLMTLDNGLLPVAGSLAADAQVQDLVQDCEHTCTSHLCLKTVFPVWICARSRADFTLFKQSMAVIMPGDRAIDTLSMVLPKPD